MKRLLVLAYDFPPIASAAAQRTCHLVRHLLSYDWQPIVVTPRAGTSWGNDPETARDLPPEIEVHRTGSIEPARVLRRLGRGNGSGTAPPASLVSRRLREWLLVPDSRAGWIPFALGAAGPLLGRVRAVLTADPPSAHVAGIVLRRIVDRPWIADFHDPWSLPSYDRWEGRWRPWVDSRLERAVLTGADRVLATTNWMAEYLASRGAGDRVRVIANGFDPDEFRENAATESTFTILHAGSFYGPRSPEPLLAAVTAALDDEPDMRASLRLVLRDWQDAENAARLEEATRRLGIGDVVERVSEVPRRDALAAMQASSVLAVVTDRVEGGHGLVPLKLYEYLGAGRPVLALAPLDGETGRVARAAGGIVVDPTDTAGAAAVIRELHAAWRAGEDGYRPDPAMAASYRWDRLGGELAQVLVEALREGGR